jgi:RecA/RadA recombinase
MSFIEPQLQSDQIE